jgi:hypothetical protein
MIPLLTEALCSISALPRVLRLPTTIDNAQSQYWWADDSLAGFSLSAVEAAIFLIEEYNSLPLGVGAAGARQKLIDDGLFSATIQSAIDNLQRVSK